MNCFSTKVSNRTPRELPQGLKYNILYPEYNVTKFEKATKKIVKGTNIILIRKKLRNENYSYAKKYPWIKTISFNLSTSKDKEYFCVQINNKNSKDPNKILIFSNGENSNICGMIPFLTDLSSYLRINILVYEYPELEANLNLYEKEQEMLQSTLTVISYAYALNSNKSIILMGYSTGVYLNLKVVEILINKSKSFKSKLKHIINISPMWCFDSSFSKKIFHYRKYSNFIKNIIKIINLKLKISTFISHGVKDDQIGYMITMKICSRLNFVYEWYPKEGDHYNIILKDNYRRKLLQRLKKFLLVDNSILIGDELDDSVLYKITHEGIKVNITKDPNKLNTTINNNNTSFNKDLNISSGNFFFASEKKVNNIPEEKNEKKSLGIKSRKSIIKSENSSIMQDRKESGFSFLDISLQKMNINFGENIDEIKDEDDNSDEDDFNENKIINDNKNDIEPFYEKIKVKNEEENDNDSFEDEENEEKEKVVNKINIINNINIINTSLNKQNNNMNENNKDDNGIINIVSSIIKEKNEILNESINNSINNTNNKIDEKSEKGFLINDSFAVNNTMNNTGDKITFEISFRKEENNK